MTVVSFVVAYGRGRVMGKDNAIPWRAPADVRHFRDITRGKPVVMGRRTFESIGRPLPDRLNIVLTRDPGFRAEGCRVARSLTEALALAGDAPEVMVIGGAQVFAALFPTADRLYITEIDADFDGDTYFPEFDRTEWREIERRAHPPEEGDPLPYDIVTYERQRTP